MKRTLIISLCFALCFSVTSAQAELASDELLDRFGGLRNPFASWLPKVEEIIEKLPEPTKIDIEQPVPVLPQPLPTVQPQEPVVEPEQKAPSLVINGVIWGTDKPQAIINDRVVSIGDTIENSKVVDIHQNGVDVIFSNKLFTIKIEQSTTQAI